MATQFHEAENPGWKKPFFTIWFGQAFSILGSQVVQFALIWYLTKQTGSGTVLATATLAGMLPQILLGPLAGSWVDRGNRRRIMIFADAGIALSTLVLVVLFALGSAQIWHIYAMMALRSLGGAFHSPAFGASSSLMVPLEHLARIQGLNQTLNGGLNIVSAPLGALLLELLPMQGVLAVDIITAAIAITPLLFIPIPQPERRTVAEGGHENNFWEDFREGFTYLRSWPGILSLGIMATLINFLLTPSSALSPLLVTEHFGGGALELSYIEAAFAAGVIGGGILLSIWGGFKKRIVTSVSAIIGIGIGIAVMGFVPADGFYIGLAGMALAGVMLPLANGSLGAIFQAVIDPAMQGRAMTLIGSLAMAMSPLGLLIAGPLADIIGVQTWFLIGGFGCIVMGLYGFSNKAIMNVENGHRSPDAAKLASPEMT